MNTFSEELNESCREATKLVMEQRTEILKAFIAKYGWEPEFTVQVQQGGKWWVERREPDMTHEDLVEAAIALGNAGKDEIGKRFYYYAKRFEPIQKFPEEE